MTQMKGVERAREEHVDRQLAVREPLYKVLAGKVAWEPPPGKFKVQRDLEIKVLVERYLPSGSGWNTGTKLDDKSTGERLVFYGSFDHMNDIGYYDGWTEHSIIVTPSLQWGFELRITGRDRNGIKEYLHDLFSAVLRQEVPAWPLDRAWYLNESDEKPAEVR